MQYWGMTLMILGIWRPLLMDHFLYWFSMFSEKIKKIYQLEVWIFWKMHHWIPFFLALCLSLQRFQMSLTGLRPTKRMATLGIIYTTDSLLQNMTKIVCLHWPTFSIFNYKPLYSKPCWIMCTNFSKLG